MENIIQRVDSFIPEGYEQISSVQVELQYSVAYQDSDNHVIIFSYAAEYCNIGIDTENTAADPDEFMHALKVDIFHDETFVFTAIRNDTITLPPRKEGIFSVFCLGPEAHGITIRGAKYCLEGANLDAFFPLGVSNHFQGEEVEITVEDGCLLIG